MKRIGKTIRMLEVQHQRRGKRARTASPADYDEEACCSHISMAAQDAVQGHAEPESNDFIAGFDDRYLQPSRLSSASSSSSSPTVPRMNSSLLLSTRKKNLFCKLLDAGVVQKGEVVVYRCTPDSPILKEGWIGKRGVTCCCCERLFSSLSAFQAHAGSDRPSLMTTFLLNDGRSLATCLLESQGLTNHHNSEFATTCDSSQRDIHAEFCQACGDAAPLDGGRGFMMTCCGCYELFHPVCVGFDKSGFLPSSVAASWFCPLCRCGLCNSTFETSMVQVSQQCTQCGLRYHLQCMMRFSTPPRAAPVPASNTSFCSVHCEDLFARLHLLVGILHPLVQGRSWMVAKSFGQQVDQSFSFSVNDQLSKVLDVMQQCFCPIVDEKTNTSILSQVIFNRLPPACVDSRRLDCSGFYSFLLVQAVRLKGVLQQEVICSASFRIHGSRSHGHTMAEVPFISTSPGYQQKGFCKMMMAAFESMLIKHGVSSIVIPSIEDMVSTWTDKFGFRKIHPQERKQVCSKFNLMLFSGTTLLYKPLVTGELHGSLD